MAARAALTIEEFPSAWAVVVRPSSDLGREDEAVSNYLARRAGFAAKQLTGWLGMGNWGRSGAQIPVRVLPVSREKAFW